MVSLRVFKRNNRRALSTPLESADLGAQTLRVTATVYEGHFDTPKTKVKAEILGVRRQTRMIQRSIGCFGEGLSNRWPPVINFIG